MKNFNTISLIFLLILGVSCAEEEVVPVLNINRVHDPADTLSYSDTLLVIDTLYFVDSLEWVDSVVVEILDTLTFTDTIFVSNIDLSEWEFFGSTESIRLPVSYYDQDILDTYYDAKSSPSIWSQLEDLADTIQDKQRLFLVFHNLKNLLDGYRNAFIAPEYVAMIPRIQGKYLPDPSEIVNSATVLFIKNGCQNVIQYTRTSTHEYYERFSTKSPFTQNAVPLYLISSGWQTIGRSEGSWESDFGLSWEKNETISIVQRPESWIWAPVDPFYYFMYNSDILINPDQSGELTAFVRSAECQNGNTYCEKVYEAEWDSQGLGNWTWYDENDVIIESGYWED